MRTRQRTNKAGARLLAVLAALSMGLPAAGALAADVTNCTPGGATAPDPANDCPEFSPDYNPTIEKPWASTITSITQRWDQQAGESNPVSVVFKFPKAWNFAVKSVKDSGIYSALNSDDANCQLARIANSEVISAAGGLILKSKSGATTTFTGSNSRVLFLHTDEVTLPDTTVFRSVLLCIQFGADSGPTYSIAARLESISGDPTYGWSMSMNLDRIARDPNNKGTSLTTNKTMSYFTVGIAGISAGNWNVNAAGKLSPVIFSRAPFDPETTAMSATWQVCRNGVRAIGATYAPPAPGQTSCNDDNVLTLTAERPLTIMLVPNTTYALDFGRLTGPNRIANTGTGVSSNPIQVSGYGLVKGTNVANVTWTQPGGVVDGVRQYGPDATIRGYVLVVSQPGIQDARHFDRFMTQEFEVDVNNYVVKDGSGQPVPRSGFDPNGPCGTDGTSNACTFKLKFPMTGVGGMLLTGNAKYDLALVTIYADGFRTDGLCDDGTGPGAICDAGRAGHDVVRPGISAWQFLMRTEQYANVYMEYYLTGKSGSCFSQGPTSSIPGTPPNQQGFGNGIDGCTSANKNVQPRFILFLDYATKRADFVIWGPTSATALHSNLPFVWGYTQVGISAQNGPDKDYSGQSNAIQGTNDTGVVSFGSNFKPDGSAESWRFDGITNTTLISSGGSTLAGTPCFSIFLIPGQPFGGTKAACGVFTVVRPNNWTLGRISNPVNPGSPLTGTCIGITVATCQPNVIVEPFEGVKI